MVPAGSSRRPNICAALRFRPKERRAQRVKLRLSDLQRLHRRSVEPAIHWNIVSRTCATPSLLTICCFMCYSIHFFRFCSQHRAVRPPWGAGVSDNCTKTTRKRHYLSLKPTLQAHSPHSGFAFTPTGKTKDPTRYIIYSIPMPHGIWPKALSSVYTVHVKQCEGYI